MSKTWLLLAGLSFVVAPAFASGSGGLASPPLALPEPRGNVCFPPLVSAICASASGGAGESCGRVAGQVWCQGDASVSGRGWSPVGLGPGTTVWTGSATASWTCTGLCECPQWADCNPTRASSPTPCTWNLGDTNGCGHGASWDLPIVFAFEGTCITYTVSWTSTTTATNGFAATDSDPGARTFPAHC